jgi:hypothetical protein
LAPIGGWIRPRFLSEVLLNSRLATVLRLALKGHLEDAWIPCPTPEQGGLRAENRLGGFANARPVLRMVEPNLRQQARLAGSWMNGFGAGGGATARVCNRIEKEPLGESQGLFLKMSHDGRFGPWLVAPFAAQRSPSRASLSNRNVDAPSSSFTRKAHDPIVGRLGFPAADDRLSGGFGNQGGLVYAANQDV